MSKILDLYKEVLESKQRFVDEIFEAEIYKAAVPQLTIIDLGAYEGEFPFYCLNFAKVIYAFEPDPTPYKVLEDRVNKYELSNKIKCFPQAMADKTGDRLFFASGFGGSTLSDDKREQTIEVKAINILEFFEINKIEHVDILKVDIEGGENEIFNDENFAKVADKIDLIIGEHLESVKTRLESLGYESKQVEGNNLIFTRKNANI